MAGKRVVRDGQSVASIAVAEGLRRETVWNHPENAALKEKRRSDYALLNDTDELYVPDRMPKTVQIPIDTRTTFRMPDVPEILRIRFADAENKPRKGLAYLLQVDGQADISGTTDDNGGVVHAVPVDAAKGRLTLRDEWEEPEVYELFLSHLDPHAEITGVQQRLCNLGFDCASEYGAFGPKTEAALLAFQARENLKQTGEADEATRERLDALHRF